MPTFSPDDAKLALRTTEGRVLLLNTQDGSEVTAPLKHGGEVHALAFHPNGEILISGGFVSKVRLWDMATYQLLATLEGHQEDVFGAAVSPDGRHLATTGGTHITSSDQMEHEGEVCLWDLTARTLEARFTAHHGCVVCAVFTPDGESLVTTGRDGMVHIWNVQEILETGIVGEAEVLRD
jgi:WD40 repeat protein